MTVNPKRNMPVLGALPAGGGCREGRSPVLKRVRQKPVDGSWRGGSPASRLGESGESGESESGDALLLLLVKQHSATQAS